MFRFFRIGIDAQDVLQDFVIAEASKSRHLAMTRSLEASECLGGNRIAITTEDNDDDCDDDGDDWTGREVPRILASRRVSH